MKEASTKKVRLRSVIVWYATVSTAALLVLITLVSALFLFSTAQIGALTDTVSSLEGSVAELSSLEAAAIYAEAIFVVKETSAGKIGIFSFSDGVLIEELNVYTYSLPPTDRNYLSSGILIYSVNELISIIEDYTG